MDVLAASASLVAEPEQPSSTPRSEAQIEVENKFQKAVAVWKGIDLGNLLSQHDTTATDVVAHQKESLVQRKELAQRTKEFRRYDDARKLTEIKGLLKLYQSFVDLLTSHVKTASGSYLQLYTALSEAPDPYPLLEASVDALVLSEHTLPKLTQDKEALEKRVNRLTLQLEATEQKLADEREARRTLEAQRDAQIKGVEKSWEAVLAEKTHNWESKEKEYQEKTVNQERLLKELKATAEVAQKLQQNESDGASGTVSAAVTTTAELEIVSAELERANLRLADVEARNESMRLELAQAAAQQSGQAQELRVEDDPSYQRLQSENSALLRRVETARYEKDTERRAWENRISASERASAKLAAERDELKQQLQKRSDYDDIKRELDVMRSIEFATAGYDDDEPDQAGKPDADSDSTKDAVLERLLLARNKKMSNELTVLRVSHQDLQSQMESLQGELQKTKADLEDSRKLSRTLENDLLQLQNHTPNFSSAQSIAPTHASRHPSRPLRTGRVSPTSSIFSGFDHSSSSPTIDALRGGEPVGGGSGILPMVQAQRDRFKQKNDQLEEELSKTYAIVRSLRQEVASLQKDNLQLYEKSRFVAASGAQSGAGSSPGSVGRVKSPVGVYDVGASPGIDSSVSSRYASAYEAQISPFMAFRGNESARALQQLSAVERGVFSLARTVLVSRTSRNLFAAYCVTLHFLLFVFLYKLSVLSGVVHESTLAGMSSMSHGGGAPAGGVDLTQMQEARQENADPQHDSQ